MAPESGWFDGRSAEAVRDFWQLDELLVQGHEQAGRFFQQTNASLFDGALADHVVATRERLRHARDGDWRPLETYLQELGGRHAEQGVDVGEWRQVSNQFYSWVLPSVVTALSHEPERLCGVLLVLRDYISSSLDIILRQYHAVKERRHRATEARHVAVLDASPDPVIAMDSNGVVTAFNPAAQRVFGYSHREAVGKPLTELVIPERFRARHTAGLARMVATGRSEIVGRRVEMVAERADGSELPVELAIVTIATPDGEIAFTGFLRDLSEQKQQEESRAFWSHALEQADFGIIVSEPLSRRITRVNPAYARMLGYEPSELVGISGDQLMIPSPGELAHIAKSLGERGHHTYDLLLRHKDGSVVPVLTSSRVVATVSGAQLLVSTVINVSERVRLEHDNEVLVATLERRVSERTAELQAANRELEAFSYSVSHDLRTPLRAIDGFSRALIADCASQLDDHGKHYLERIRSGTNRMGKLIDDMLALARIGRATIDLRTVDVTALATEVVNELRAREPIRDVAVTVEPGLVARADVGLARIVLDNLIGNAWKFTARTPRPEIAIGIRDGVLFVRDTGAGFDMAYADKLFQPFQRLHANGGFEGTGIGLATVHRIVMHHRGRVWLEAAVGVGTTAYFTFGDRA